MTETEIINAINDAAFRKDLEMMEAGLDTVVGEQGVTLGGQKQRLAIARALLANRKY